MIFGSLMDESRKTFTTISWIGYLDGFGRDVALKESLPSKLVRTFA